MTFWQYAHKGMTPLREAEVPPLRTESSSMKIYKKNYSHSSIRLGQARSIVLTFGIIITLPFRLLLSFFLAILKLLTLRNVSKLQYLIPSRLLRNLNATQRLFLNVIIASVFLIFGVLIFTSFINPEQTKAAWFNEQWSYRQTVSITNSSGSELTDFQIVLTLDTATLITNGKMQADCDDIRITDQKGVLLSYWIEKQPSSQACNTSTTKIWVKMPTIPISGGTLLLYYGNPSAQKGENGQKTFIFFDDFDDYNGTTITEKGKWQILAIEETPTASITTASGSAVLYLRGASNGNAGVYTPNFQIADGVLEMSVFNFAIDQGLLWRVANTSNLYLLRTNPSSNGKVDYFKRQSGAWTNLGSASTSTWTWLQVWHTLSIKFSGSSHIAFIDGTQASSLTDSTFTSAGGVGMRKWGMDGSYYDNIRVRKYVATEPTVSFGSEEQSPGPIAYWSMDEGYGTTVFDKTTRGNNGTISGATWKPTSECKVGKCLYFDGINDVVDFGNIATTASISGNVTISFWIKPTNIAKGRQNPLGKAYGGEYDLTLETNGSLSNYHGSAGTNASPYVQFNSPAIAQNEWTHVVYVRDTSNRSVKIYLNGILRTSGTYASTYDPTVSTRSFKFGYEYVGYYQGYLDEVIIFSTVKSSEEIKAIFAAGKAGIASHQGSSATLGKSTRSILNQGLVGYWKMDETTGTNALDVSGNNRTASFSGTPSWIEGKYGSALSTDNTTNDKLLIGGTVDIGSAWSAAAWFKLPLATTGGTWNTLFRGNGGDHQVIVQRSTNLIGMYHNTNGGFRSSGFDLDTLANGWHHLAVVAENGIQKFYIDGTYVGATDRQSTTDIYAIGNCTCNGQNWGKFDDVRIYNRALSPAEVQQLYNFSPGPLVYFDFEEKLGTTIHDKSGNNNNSTSFGGNPRWVQGKFGSGLSFDGDDYVRVNRSIMTASDSAITFWIKMPVQSSNDNRLLSDSANGIDLYLTGTGTNGLYGTIGNSTSGWTMASPNIADNNWHFIALVSTASDGYTRAYLDGKLQSSTSKTYSTMILDDLYIGSNAGGANYQFTGTIDELKIYNYARTPKQIIEDMNAGHPIGGSPVGSQVGYWKFDEGYGSTARDSGPNRLDGTITSGIKWSNDGINNKALLWDGTSNKAVTIADNSALDMGNDSFTISAWFKKQGTNYHAIVEKRGTGLLGYLFIVDYPSEGKASIFLNDTTNSQDIYVFSNANISQQNHWYHLAVVVDRTAGTATLYKDGKPVQSVNTTGTTGSIDSDGSLRIGYDLGGVAFNGMLDDVKIYRSALASSEIQIDYNRNASLVLGAGSTSDDGLTASNSASRAYCVPGDTNTCNPPILEWNFEEKTGNSINDTSGNGNTGSNSGGTWVQGKYGAALRFDSTVNGVYGSITPFSNNAWTTSYWIKPKQLNIQQNHARIDDGGGNRLVPYMTSGNVFCTWTNSGQTCGTTTAQLDQWYFITNVYDGSNVYIYVNGKQENSSPLVLTSATWSRISYLGSDNGALKTNAVFDQFRIYNYARTPAQIAWDYNRGKPIAHWKMDECQGTIVHDSSGNNLHGTISIGASGSQTSVGTCQTSSTAWYNGATGKFNYSLNFDGTDDYVNIPGSWLYDNQTVAFWAKDDWSSATGIPLSSLLFVNPDHDGFRFIAGTNQMTFNIYNNNQSEYTYTASVTGTGWHHFVLTWTPTETKAYVDGRLVNSSARTNDFDSDTSDMDIGRYNYQDNNYFSGQVDDVQIFNYALTPVQVKNLYNQEGGVRFGPEGGAP